ncbi:MAG: ATP synthase F0 subunit B [Candidatus Magasanikbacteria bacterium CG10_big_fil_rev_8_21_14_0_10_42_10]|uniref:ATP synthase subunit b n=2 Tax=Candidatus Magasanikiibacteriota TaxID=1752731 RepID=A0A2H0TV04_9BACT|nr:MAG: ATP synthase F0 subunit B [Candidatus Magasanikbacteria bacterium CG10_big_fil_rev_8_21_14_0_10_42_10]PIZ92478.1 MAG: ATP synthase F0 subunit B [Candidatus Magasanikbacteria bacterium CG_4_10_14_0_2_um_filter_41_10]
MEYILGILGKIGFDWRMGLFNLINFLVVFWLLKRFAFGPVMKMVDERQQKAKDAIDNFTQAKTELQMAERKAQDLIDASKVEANKNIEQSHQKAKEAGEQMKEKAKKEIELLIVQAKRNIDIDKKEMKESLRKDTVELIVLAVEKIMTERLDEKKDLKMIQEILATLK